MNPHFLSFKIVRECPSITIFLFKLHEKYMDDNVPVLLGLMVAAISNSSPEDVSPDLRKEKYYVEFKYAQIKVRFSLLISNFNENFYIVFF